MTSGPSFPEATDTDAEEVSWALSTGQAMWKRGDHAEGIKWIKKASDAAADAGDDDRAFTLARAAAELKSTTGAGTVPPPAPTAAPAPPPPPAPAASATVTPIVPPPTQTAKIAPPPPARGSGSVGPAKPTTAAPPAKPAGPVPPGPTAGGAKPTTPLPKPAGATATPLPSAGAKPAPPTATPLPKPAAGKPVGAIPAKPLPAAGAPAKEVPPPPAPRSQIPTPTEEHAAPTFSDDLDAPTMMLQGNGLEPEAPTKAFPKEMTRELTSTHVWIFRDDSGKTRVVARSGKKPSGALDAVMVTSDGAALSMMIDEA